MKKEQFYIKFLNKDKNFKEDIIYFNTWDEAYSWATTDNFEKFNPDMISIV